MANQQGQMKKKPGTRQRRPAAARPRMVRERNAPVARSMRNPVRAPSVQTQGTSTLVRNEEPMAFLSSSATSGTEVTGALQLSAASSALPWLSQIGLNYGRYRFRKLCCWYEPVCASTTPGQITLVMVFDENDTSSPTSTNILQTEGNKKASVWDRTNLCEYNQTRAQFRWYIVKPNPTSNTVANISVPAWLLYAAFSSDVGIGLGRLMCRYEVEFDSAIAPAMNA
jgi:hypothetical protein